MSIMSRFAPTGKLITAFGRKPITLSLRPGVKSMESLVKGNLLTVNNKTFAVVHPPQYPVLRFLDERSFKKEANSINHKNVVSEKLTTLNGTSITVYYVKDHSKMRRW